MVPSSSGRSERLIEGLPYRVRAARPGDAPALRHMLDHESHEDLRLRFFRAFREVPESLIGPMLRDEGRRHAALVVESDDPALPLVASAMLAVPPASEAGEFGIIVARRHAGHRIGSRLLDRLIELARARGLTEIYGLILSENTPMIDLARRRGFTIRAAEEPGCVKAVRPLHDGTSATQDSGERISATPTM